ncbi:hypothetical protein GOP47_0025263 [Adiantum capillus-veneris]|uniref:Large ribosomal subunit protein uL10c n=1 Tax=Adiantum capillus-veneris TaxID=13818 RepID=A0A9D4Z2V2_ADICA|nr:hypothetical protein GOP47_0025263 [Adiantum capillus-veneris]
MAMATTMVAPPTLSSETRGSPSLRSSFLGSPSPTLRQSFLPATPSPSCPALRVDMAISREKKEFTIEKVREQLEGAYLVAGIKYTGLTVKQLQDIRRKLPETVTLRVAKNTLMSKAIEGTQWEALKPCLKGMNAWLFVKSEEIPAALKPYRDMQRELKLDKNDFTGAVFEGKFFAPEEFKVLETMPSRAEIYAKLLGSLQSPAISLIGTLQAPARDLVLTLKAYVQKLEEEAGSA